jgi:hypothetical protein
MTARMFPSRRASDTAPCNDDLPPSLAGPTGSGSWPARASPAR